MGLSVALKNEIRQMLHDYHESLRHTHTPKADEIKSIIELTIDRFKNHKKLYTYYLLLTYRYYVLTLKNDLAESTLKKLEGYKTDFDGYFSFLYLFLRGLHAFLNKDVLKSLSYYKSAEKKLENIEIDELDKAEFYYRFASSYYKMEYYDFTIKYATSAFNIFKRNALNRRWVSCLNLLGAAYVDSGNFVKATKYYDLSVKYCKRLNNQELNNITLQNLGWLYSRMGEPEKAINYYIMALKKNERPDHQLPTLFLLARECFRFGEEEEGLKWLKEGLEVSQRVHDEEYEWHFKILEAIFVRRDKLEETLVEGIEFFKRNGIFWDYVKDYALELADRYYDEGNFERAAKYYKLVGKAGEYINIKNI